MKCNMAEEANSEKRKGCVFVCAIFIHECCVATRCRPVLCVCMSIFFLLAQKSSGFCDPQTLAFKLNSFFVLCRSLTHCVCVLLMTYFERAVKNSDSRLINRP